MSLMQQSTPKRNEKDPQCLPDTRVDLLRQIRTWINDRDDKKYIFWLSGMAGTGKSTISRTIAHEFRKLDRLGASFFFYRGEQDREQASKVITTLAVQLTKFSPDI